MRAILAPILLAATALPILAQSRNFTAQDGTLFDANPQVGAGGRNTYVRPRPTFVGGNPFATGNVRFGQSFQGVGAISDPTAFRGTLGSTSLSSFRRDSFSAGDRALYSNFGYRSGTVPQFYDPSATAPTTAYLRGLGQYAAPNQTGFQTRRTAPFTTGEFGRLDTRIDARFTPPRSPDVLGGSPQALGAPGVASSIFRLNSPTVRGINAETPDRINTDRFMPRPSADQSWMARPDVTPAPQTTLLERDDRYQPRIDALLGNAPAQSLLDGGRVQARLDESVLKPRLIAGVEPLTPAPFAAEPRETDTPTFAAPEPPIDRSVLPGGDVFSDMQIALALAPNPNADWFADMQRASASAATNADALADATADAQGFLDNVLSKPLTTLVGEARTTVNNELLKAESLMSIGHYYEAAQRYQSAAAIEPLNPLPLLGRANALLAAGEYNSAARSLVSAIEQFPDLARFRFDLVALLGGGEIVDIRRADLNRLLEQRDEPRLQLLLGYLEYNGGLAERGLANLRAAAEDAGPLSPLQQYVDRLEADPQGIDQPVPRRLPRTEERPRPQRPAPLILPPAPEETRP
jgi:tetratricopeptide (TPR) repeat protein